MVRIDIKQFCYVTVTSLGEVGRILQYFPLNPYTLDRAGSSVHYVDVLVTYIQRGVPLHCLSSASIFITAYWTC